MRLIPARPRRLTSPLALAALLASLLTCGCGGGGGTTGELSPAAFVKGVHHPYFPIKRGWTWHYVGEYDGAPIAEEVRTLEQPRRIRGVECTAIEELSFRDGVLVGLTTEWFAQDAAGNVWRFGEESFEREGDSFLLTADSWIAGVAGGTAWMAFGAAPRVGERYVGFKPDGQEVLEVRALDGVADVPAGVFAPCVEIASNPDEIEDTDIILYAEGVGRVAETNVTGWTHLVRVAQD